MKATEANKEQEHFKKHKVHLQLYCYVQMCESHIFFYTDHM